MPPERWSHVPLKVFLERSQPPVERNQVPPPFPGLAAGNARSRLLPCLRVPPPDVIRQSQGQITATT
jgi:hypothetical protein